VLLVPKQTIGYDRIFATQGSRNNPGNEAQPVRSSFGDDLNFRRRGNVAKPQKRPHRVLGLEEVVRFELFAKSRDQPIRQSRIEFQDLPQRL
jgi:hypothetical protein